MEQLFEKVTLQDLVTHKRDLISVPDTATVGEALKAMQTGNVSAIPVSAPVGKWLGAGGSTVVEGNHQYIGIVSALDFVVLLGAEERDFETTLKEPITSLFGGTNESMSLWVMSGDTNITDVFEPMSKGVHRVLVAVKQEENTKLFMLTQTDIVRYFLENSSELGSAFSFSLKELELTGNQSAPVIVEASTPVMEAIYQMRMSGTSAVPVVDKLEPCEAELEGSSRLNRTGRILATLSGSDFRRLNSEILHALKNMTVIEYLRTVSGLGIIRAPVTCRPGDSLIQVVADAVTTKIHRVWITDDSGRFLGVVSFSDMIKFVREMWKAARPA